MRKHLGAWMLAGMLSGAAQALGYSLSAANLGATIPDGDLNGYANTLTTSGVSGAVGHLSVTLNISGGFNGDLYAYLYHDGYSAILLNRVGRTSSSSPGYPDAGFGLNVALNSFTFDDQAGQDVHWYRTFPYALNGSGQLTGLWQPDGRAVDPLSAGSVFDTALRSNPLGGFNGMDPNGPWTLYLADVSSGGVSTLNSWGLTIDVPEPSGATLLCCGLLGMLWATLRLRSRPAVCPPNSSTS